MKTLIEDLHDNNVIFSYYGFIDANVLTEVLLITKSKLESNNESDHVVERVSDAINNCVDNIIKHNFYPDDERVHYKSLLVVSKQNNFYLIDTINVVTPTQKETLSEQLEFINSRTKEEIKALKSNLVLSNSVKVGTGFVDLILKADNCECTFKDLDANHLVNINFKINSLN
ncbi:MAG: DUF6272 family protein [bacterium]|nr:DUF6272 family protein [bacterium]